MTTPLTPTQIIADLKALDRIEHDWSAEGRLDGLTKDSLDDKRADLMDELRARFTTVESEYWRGEWSAYEGDYDLGIPVATGKSEIEAIENLLEMIGEDA